MVGEIKIFSIIVLIFSVVIHEVAHGYTALFFGDQTAKNAGRLTLNPIKHIDLLGSIIIPLILVILPGNFILGWAKPVPYNPYNLKNRKWGEFWVAFAGPLSNLIIGVLFIFLIRISPLLNISSTALSLMLVIIIINFVLAFFNLIPVPPLDGSKILLNLLPLKYYSKILMLMQSWGLFFILAFIFFLWTPFFSLVLRMISLATGMNIL